MSHLLDFRSSMTRMPLPLPHLILGFHHQLLLVFVSSHAAPQKSKPPFSQSYTGNMQKRAARLSLSAPAWAALLLQLGSEYPCTVDHVHGRLHFPAVFHFTSYCEQIIHGWKDSTPVQPSAKSWG